jgi:hypothetical protein
MYTILIRYCFGALVTFVLLLGCGGSSSNAVYSGNGGPPHNDSPDIPDGELLYVESITKDDVTWTFSTIVPVGQFVNGDYYVVGPVTIIDIDPLPTLVNGRHGSVLNMPGNNSSISPFDYRVEGNRYRPEYRIYPPFDMKPGDLLISSISIEDRGDFEPWLREGQEVPSSYVRSVSILTCLAEQVSADAFRPGYADRAHRIYRSAGLRRDLLPRLPHVSNVPDIDVFAAHFRRPWLDVCFFGFDAAVEYQAVYGREVGRAVGMATLLLMLDISPEEKEALLIHVIQYAIDLWALAREGYPGWPAHGGHGSGRKWAIIFGGIMLSDEEMQNPSRIFPNLKFGEDMHTAYDTCWTGANVVYTGHQGLWNGTPVNSTPSWGPYEHLRPSRWGDLGGSNPFIGEGYRRCCTSIAWVGQALAARLMGAEALWNHDPFFVYVDRWMTEDDSQHVETIRMETGRDYSANWQRQGQAWDRFVNEMWAAYR